MPQFELNYPKKVQLTTSRFEMDFSTKKYGFLRKPSFFYLEELILCGIKHLEVTNFGNPQLMPQFKDADELLKKLRDSKKLSRAV